MSEICDYYLQHKIKCYQIGKVHLCLQRKCLQIGYKVHLKKKVKKPSDYQCVKMD